MFEQLPKTPQEITALTWPQLAPYFQELQARPLTAATVDQWLLDWSALSRVVDDLYNRLYVATTVNTNDRESDRRYHLYLDELYSPYKTADQRLKEKLLASGLQPAGFDIPLRNLRAEVGLFHLENLPLLAEEHKLNAEYDKISGAQTVHWDGREVTLRELIPVFQETDRGRREQAWRMMAARQLADRQAVNALWSRLVGLRHQMAVNAGLSDHRAYQWQAKMRFDYTPADCITFHNAIEQVVVPAARRMYAHRARHLGVETLRPWDLDVDLFGHPPLRPFASVEKLKSRTAAIFHHVDPQLGGYFQTMIDEGLLDLGNRKHKAPGGYCTFFAVSNRPFIFMNAVGLHEDAQTLLHEGGHAFHVFETAGLRHFQDLVIPMEFIEVASMAMELLGAPYLTSAFGGYYSEAEAARALAEHLESNLRFWPYMAVVDAFQHWAYLNPRQSSDPARCDSEWGRLWNRFMTGIDYSGLDEVRLTGWQRKMHLVQSPFYYIEYGLAQLGAIQIWANARRDQAAAVQAYRRALALGGTVTLPELFATAGARFAFDAGTLQQAVDLIETVIAELEQIETRGK